LRIEEIVRPITQHPLLQELEMRGIRTDVRYRHLMRPPGTLEPMAVDLLGRGPALRRAQNYHRPARPARHSASARLFLERADFEDATFERSRHPLMHSRRSIALDHVRLVAVANEKALELLGRYAGKNRRIGNLVTVEMQNRQHGSVADRIEEFVRMPRRRQRASLRLAVPHHCGHDQIGIVERSPEGMRQAVSEFAALMNRARGLGCAMTADSAGKGKQLEKLFQ